MLLGVSLAAALRVGSAGSVDHRLLLSLLAGDDFAGGRFYLFDIQLNFINAVVLPNLLAIAVDNSVHLFHRYEEEGPGSLGHVVRHTGFAAVVVDVAPASAAGGGGVVDVPLGAEGGDWAATPDDRRIFVTLPARGEVAVVNSHTWKVEARIPAGARPTGARMQPGARRLWVTDEASGVVVIDRTARAHAPRRSITIISRYIDPRVAGRAGSAG